MNQALNKQEILDLIPQQAPFRFIDDIIEVSEAGITGVYTYRPDEYFYRGHFPGNPVTPGVILLETMAQTGVVAYGLYLLSLQMDKSGLSKYITLFSDAEVEYFKPVYPGDTVTIKANKVFWRRMKLKSEVTMLNQTNEIISTCLISGMGVKS